LVDWEEIPMIKLPKFIKKIRRLLDMNKKDVYLYHSPATDVTGKNLADALGIKAVNSGKKGETKPPKTAKMVIAWGAKTRDNIDLGKAVVMNHPDCIRDNRNKLVALQKMRAGGVSVADFQELVGGENNLPLPVIARKKYHQGGKGFWVCPTKSHVNDAIKDGAQYIQTMIEIKDEYRLHIFDEEVLYGQKKVKRTKEDFEKAFVEDELNRQKVLWEKNNEGPFNELQAKEMLKRQAKHAVAGGANMMVRSNKMGWKFSRITKYDDALVKEAVKALKSLGLVFGAVDCCTDVDGNPFIIEVNTGPGLEGTPFDVYVSKFKEIIKDGDVPIKDAKEKVKTSANAVSVEAGILKNQTARLNDELGKCKSEEELAAIKRLGSVIFGGR
jgi:hypothetical protein